MQKSEYKVLVFNQASRSLRDLKKALSKNYRIVAPQNIENAIDIIKKERVDLALLCPDSLIRLTKECPTRNDYRNPNMIKILLAEEIQAGEMMLLEQTGRIYYWLSIPVSSREIMLTFDMAFKNYEILVEKNRLLSKLNKKAFDLLKERKKLSNAFKRLKDANLDSVRVLSEAIEAKDPYTRGHCKRVSNLAKAIAEHVGYDKEMIRNLELAAFLHDIGKIGIKGAVLNKDGRLTQDEMDHVRTHTLIGENIINTIKWCRKFIPAIRSHHEMYDGSGYPDGIKGEEIPLDARILSIADAFDAMTSERPYRQALPLKEALKRIKNASGSQFDSKLVDIFISKKIYSQDLSTVTGLSFKTKGSKSREVH